MSALLSEVAGVLANSSEVLCVPTAEIDEKGCVVLTIRMRPGDQKDRAAEMEVLAIAGELRYLADLASMRAFATQYNIDPAQLERLLPKRGEE